MNSGDYGREKNVGKIVVAVYVLRQMDYDVMK
jgi:hypothetical protein